VPSASSAVIFSPVSPANRFPAAGVALLFLSGMCGLILQVCWFREFRFIFGGTAAASAAVLAAFMAGLGLGNALLGPRADKTKRPLFLYAILEAAIALSAALTPFLIDTARGLFLTTGGQSTLGGPAATAVRLGLSFVVLVIPTFLMGGTLPAAASAFTRASDAGRSATAWLYGANTFGAVAGAFLATFFLLENFGVRQSLWIACVLAAVASFFAFLLARHGDHSSLGPAGPAGRCLPTHRAGAVVTEEKEKTDAPLAPVWLLAIAAALSGFVFFAMELVWFRMLAPILGGTTFTFGLIVAVALAGIGIGAVLYAVMFARRRPTLQTLAFTALVGAVCLAAPLAAGDRLAVLVAFLDAEFVRGFVTAVMVWTLVAALVVFPFAVVAGVQFPLIVALCGAGPQRVGRQVGLVYAGNTLGSILGALAGGFGLLPLLTALGAWQVMSFIALLAGAALLFFLHRRERLRQRPVIFAPVLAVLALWFLLAEGPTAVWRHGGVGADRIAGLGKFDPNSVREWKNLIRSSFIWEADGIESSVGISDGDGLAFYVNGKCDGNAISDAGMQIMLGLIGAAWHPDPRTAFVVGLGTGETAGWLAKVPSIERVDVAEIEPATLEMARRCTPVNHDVLDNPKVQIELNDARELLLTGKSRYDLIACEPSNPYRAGVADLFTKEFYQAARNRLAEGGIFLQWLQGYEVDEQTVRTVLATLRSVFPHVEIWQTMMDDLVIVCSEKPPQITADELRRRLASEPFASALPAAWFTTGAEGFLAHYLGGPALVDAFVRGGGQVPVSTDNHNRVEYGFARTLGKVGLFDAKELADWSVRLGDTRAPVVSPQDGTIDWDAVSRARLWDFADSGILADPAVADSVRTILEHRVAGDVDGMLAAWETTDQRTASLAEIMAVAGAYASRGDARAEPLIAQLRPSMPAVADVLSARLAWARGDVAGAAGQLESAFLILRESPWMPNTVMEQAFVLAVDIARGHPEQASRMLAALAQPLAAEATKRGRLKAACFIAASGPPEVAIPFLEAHEPHVPWAREFLAWRHSVYLAAGHPLASKAAAELEEYERNDAVGKRNGN
jgi:spermidine synthase